jgi:hypothetical protein
MNKIGMEQESPTLLILTCNENKLFSSKRA